jgi:arylsulfatase A-like enzyme
MKSQLTRREFLKSTGVLSLLPHLQRVSGLNLDGAARDPGQPNIIFILFDALSAYNLSLYGYPRATSPNLERFANRSAVYHNHHSAANFTTPSTASLFTSTYPWEHRAITLTGLIRDEIKPNNLFKLLSEKYYQAAFTQNVYADMLLYQFDQYLDQHFAPDDFSLVGSTYYDNLSGGDAIYGLKGFDQFLFKREEAHGSLFLSILNDINTMLGVQINNEKFKEMHPHGIPRLANTDVYFLFSQVMDGVMDMLTRLPAPYFSYIHLLPPHSPYMPSSQFLDIFDDGWAPETKKFHKLGTRVPEQKINFLRQRYDEFVANLDFEFGRLLDHLEASGTLEDSYVIFTSDHGELFERGTHGHSTPLLFEPVIRIPLLISSPGQRMRKDIYTLTSNVDILPTLAHISGLPVPDWTEGEVLPGFGGEEMNYRSVWVLEAKKNQTRGELKKASIGLLEADQKLVYYHGYKHYQEKYEFYDLKKDPEELDNLYKTSPIAEEMQGELDQKFGKVRLPVE